MKKILTILAAVTGFAAFGLGSDFRQSGTSFESYGTNVFNAAKDDSGTQAANRYWFTADSDAANVLSNYVGDVVNADQTKTPTGVSRPDYFAPSNNTKYLSVETTGKLFRTLKSNTQDPATFQPVDIPANGGSIYLDTLVKFTAADSVFAEDLTDGDKIAIEYVEHEPEDENDVAITNFVVRAGYIGTSEISQTNYLATITNGTFDATKWHRLTVRTVSDIDGNGKVGFKIYLDENEMVYVTTDARFATSAGVNFVDDTRTIFPSVVATDENNCTAISAVSFSGNGSIDDLVFTTDMPKFIKDSENVRVTFTADSGVAAISVQVGEETPVAVDMTTLTATLPAGTTTFTVTATLDPNGYAFADMVYNNASYDNGDEIVYAGGTIAITTTRNNFNVFNGSGDPISGPFQTLGAALAATGVAKIQLAYDYDVTDADLYNGSINIDQSTTLDLNGKTLDGGMSVSDPLFFVNDGNFVIIDSVGGGKVVYDGPGIVFGSTSYIGATSGDLGPTFDGKLFYDQGEGYVIRGKFDVAGNSASGDEPTFLWSANLGDGDSVESECTGPVSGYWVVAPAGGSESKVAQIPTAATGLVFNGTEQTGVAAGTGYTLSGTYAATNAGDYTATATLEDGYVWSDSSTEAKSINWSIAAKTDATVVVALTADIAEYTAQLEFPAASATIGGDTVAGNTAWDPATISEPEAGATNTYTVTFTVTTANYAGSTGTATFKVFKTAGGGSEDWPENPSTVSGQTAQAAFGITGDLANADAAALATWAKAKGVTYADRTTAILTDAFLLDCANTQEAIATAAANFKITAITVAGDAVTITPAAGDVYGNGQVAIEGATSLASPISWHEKQAGDHFFKATLVVKPVAVP